MKFVFESKNTKESTIEEMKELFHEKTQEIVNILWELTDKVYNSNDVLDEILEKRHINSQIINPNAEHKTKHIFSSAIKDVKGDRRRKYSTDDDRKRETVKTYTVNDKKVVIRKKRSRSRSRERDEEEQDKDYNKYGNDYYMQRGYYQRGRGFKRGYGRGFMMPGFMPRR
jgi:hypothetical protein